jgi:hypothetical protein
MHSADFYHMQGSSNRNEYVEILKKQVQAKTMETIDGFLYFGYHVAEETNYDYDSIMHSSRNAFGMSGSDTIVPKKVIFQSLT